MANFIHPTAIIGENVILGDNNYIGAYCIIGDPAEHKKFWGQEKGKVIIGDNNIITGLVTIDAGTEYDTFIRNNCFIMKHAHIGHDCRIWDNVTISCGAKIAGRSTNAIKSTCASSFMSSVISNIKIGKSVFITLNSLIFNIYRLFKSCPVLYFRVTALCV